MDTCQISFVLVSDDLLDLLHFFPVSGLLSSEQSLKSVFSAEDQLDSSVILAV